MISSPCAPSRCNGTGATLLSGAGEPNARLRSSGKCPVQSNGAKHTQSIEAHTSSGRSKTLDHFSFAKRVLTLTDTLYVVPDARPAIR